ncbi:hypothetical protein OUZ56_017488 [Daphnia magna]|uniref:Uncharacterized protein n=1 Tax=Daphnia magna TaxID=35525 RepID=A0ABR0ASV3_9CRUS|nr:hypothetical protein OUZ56_017488 [Daphnia magna]
MFQQRNLSPTIVVVNVTCSGPPPFSGLPLSSLEQSDLMCSLALPVSIIILLVMSWIVLTAGLIVLVIFWRKRQNLRRESRLMIIKSSHHHYHHRDHAFQHHNGTSPILGGVGAVKQQQYGMHSNNSPALSGHHHRWQQKLQQPTQLITGLSCSRGQELFRSHSLSSEVVTGILPYAGDGAAITSWEELNTVFHTVKVSYFN